MTDVSASSNNRPGVVTAAVALQWLMLLSTLIGTVAAIAFGDDIAAAMRVELENQRVAPDIVDAVADGGNDPISLGLTVALAAGYAVLGWFNLRGSRGARITTWVFSGVLLLCSVLGMVVSTMAGNVGDGLDIDRVVDAGYAAAPGWYDSWATVSGVVSLLCCAAVVVLLALPAAADYFRTPEPDVVLPPEAG